jgi:uncharacterized membrane protein
MAAISELTERRTRDLPDSAYLDMSRILRAGLLLSLVILFGALVAYLVANPSESFNELIQTNPIAQYLGLYNLASALAQGVPEAYLTLGILVLLATPILRVVTGLYFFHRNGEKTIARIALVVTVLLILGLLVIGPIIH